MDIINARRGITVSATALLLVLGVQGLAFGETPTPVPTTSQEPDGDGAVNTEPPAEPTESLTDAPEENPPFDPDPVVTPTGKPTATDTPDGTYCGPSHGVYVPTSQGDKYHKGVGVTQGNYNGGTRTARSTFTSETAGEVGISYSGNLKVSGTVLVLSLEQTWNVNLSAKVSVKIGNTIAVDTPPHRTTNARYGAWRRQHTGKSYTLYSNCTTSTKSTIVSYTPYKVGWYIWETGA
ncbi:hypothetical protein ABZ312_23635 [Streptomyces sp. NPDC006207]